jgi:dTDP-4-dehydrorhamnose reductase
MKVLVTGIHGLLGRSLSRAAEGADSGCELIGCGRGPGPARGEVYYQADLLDQKALGQLLDRVQPDWVIHTAAITNVDLCETEKELARRVNVDLVNDLATACRGFGAGLVQLSTDYVFDGKDGPYAETDPPNPLSHYGALKLASEEPVLAGGVKGLVVRTLWLYGHVSGARKNLVTWPLEALSREEDLRIVDDQWGNPTFVDDLAKALLQLCRDQRTGLLHMGGGDFMTRFEMTRMLAHTFALPEERVQPTSTVAIDQEAPRPLRSGLRTDTLKSILGVSPSTLAQGLSQMRAQADFRRDFPTLSD